MIHKHSQPLLHLPMPSTETQQRTLIHMWHDDYGMHRQLILIDFPSLLDSGVQEPVWLSARC